MLVVLALTGCATRTVVVAPGVVANSAPELRTSGHAVVYSMDGKQTTIHADDRVDVSVRIGENLQNKQSLTLGEMAAGCDVDRKNGCVAERVIDQRVVVRHEHSLDSDLVAKGVGFIAIGGLAGYCLAACQDGEASVGKAFGYTAAVVGGTALLFILAVALGGRD